MRADGWTDRQHTHIHTCTPTQVAAALMLSQIGASEAPRRVSTGPGGGSGGAPAPKGMGGAMKDVSSTGGGGGAMVGGVGGSRDIVGIGIGGGNGSAGKKRVEVEMEEEEDVDCLGSISVRVFSLLLDLSLYL